MKTIRVIRSSYLSKWALFMLCLVLTAISVFAQETTKTKSGAVEESAQSRLVRAIEAIPALVSEGALTQDQANEITTRLKVKLADFVLSQTNGVSTDASIAAAAPSKGDSVTQVAGLERVSLRSTADSPADPPASPVTTAPADTNRKSNEPAIDKTPAEQDSFETNFVAGVEQSGYSSQINNTNFFVNAFFRNTFSKEPFEIGLRPKFALWGRVRLLSAPQPSTEGIVSTLADPTGKISQTSFTNVGQVADFVVGPEIQIYNWGKTRLSFSAGFGASTPLASNTTVATYNVPHPNTSECQELISRFGSTSEYHPHVSADPAQVSCIYNPQTNKPYDYVAFSNQDRSSFLSKWGMGFRLERRNEISPKVTDPLGTLDFGVGQDATVTGGKLRGWVFKIDGVYPLSIGNSSLLYAFGSASMRFTHNTNLAPLILTIPQGNASPTIPSDNVIILPLRQPNRDFYRIGFGLNLMDVFCAFKATGCEKKTDKTAAQPSTSTERDSVTAQSRTQGTDKTKR